MEIEKIIFQAYKMNALHKGLVLEIYTISND
jgi:hypothetical protein